MLRHQLSADERLVTESGFDLQRANAVETLFTVGNGRLGTRGTLEEGHRGEVHANLLGGFRSDAGELSYGHEARQPPGPLLHCTAVTRQRRERTGVLGDRGEVNGTPDQRSRTDEQRHRRA